jgi:hypothetical protein
MMPTAATEVALGTRMAIRRKVRARSGRFSALARNSASTICGIVASRKMPTVFFSAFQ